MAATYTGECGREDVVQVKFAPPVDVTVHVVNKGGCPVIIKISRNKLETDRKTVRAPRTAGATTVANLDGDGADCITVSCGAGAPDGQSCTCIFEYVIAQRP